MRTRQRHALLRQLREDLDTLTHRGTDGPLVDHAIQKLLEYRARGYPTGTTQIGSIGGSGTGDPTATAATQAPDPYERAMRDLDVQLSIAARSLTRAIAIAKAATATVNVNPDTHAPPTIVWCSSCMRIRDSLNRAHLSPAHVTHHDLDVDDGPLCRWCYDFARTHHVLPPTTLLEAHRDGRRITQTMVDQARAS